MPDRCDHGGEPCPGAPWQGLAYEQQLRHKQDQVGEALTRIGGLEGFELEPIEPAVERWRYRNKLEYSFGERQGELEVGVHREPERQGRRVRTAGRINSRQDLRSSEGTKVLKMDWLCVQEEWLLGWWWCWRWCSAT